MINENPHIDSALLTRFILGEVSEAEQLHVIEWLEADAANQAELDKLESAWIKSGELKPPPLPVDVPIAWNQLEQRIKANDQQQKIKNRILKPIFYAAASIAVIVFLLTILKPSSTTLDQPVLISNKTGALYTDTLPDGSLITLNQFSKLTYLSAENDPHRMMVLEGEAFFDVVRDTLRPFIIKAGMGGVRVLGTSFNVKISNKTDVTVDVKSGLVELFYPVVSQNDTLRLQLKAGERGILSHQMSSLRSNTSSPSSLFWLDNTLIFKNKPLNEVFEVLQQCYNVSIVCDDSNINFTNLSTTFTNKEINEVLDVISATFDIAYEQNGTTYRIYRP